MQTKKAARILLVLAFLVVTLLPVPAVSAARAGNPGSLPPAVSPQQETISVENLGVTYKFAEQVTFNARIQTDLNVKEVMLFVTPAGEQAVMRRVTMKEDGEIHAGVPAADLSLRPFTTNPFHFLVALESGEILTSTLFSFRYEDNRFRWNTLSNPDFEVSWYGRDAAFGQEVLDVARAGITAAGEILPVTPPTPIRIYAYDSSSDLQSALNLNQPWIVGHAAPDLGQMYIYIPAGPDQRFEIERQVPHEIMHFLQYQVAEENLRRQPVWLMEGMASLAELYPNPEYQRHLRAAADRRELLPLASLCRSFPRETFGAYLAYAQSASFTRFLVQNYGNSGLKKLMEQYNAGFGCEEGLTAAFGASLAQLEYRWKQETLGIDAGNLVLRNLSPYLLLLFVITLPTMLVFFPSNRARKADRPTPETSTAP